MPLQNKGLCRPALVHSHINRYIRIFGKQGGYFFNRVISGLLIKGGKKFPCCKTLLLPIGIIGNILCQNHSHKILGVGVVFLFIFLNIAA